MNISKLVTVVLLQCALAIPSFAGATDLPDAIMKGFSLLKEGNAKEAILAWASGSGWTNQQEFIKSTTMVLGVETSAKGELKSVEPVARVSLSASVTLYWVVLVYDRGVHYLWFEVLTRDGGQIITSMSRYNDVREMGASLSVFPEKLIQ